MAIETVTSENRQEFIDKKMGKKAEKPKKHPSEMTMSQLMKHHEKASETASAIRNQLIEAGMGQMKHTDIMAHEHPLAKTYAEHSPWHESLRQEMSAREQKKYGSKKNYKV